MWNRWQSVVDCYVKIVILGLVNGFGELYVAKLGYDVKGEVLGSGEAKSWYGSLSAEVSVGEPSYVGCCVISRFNSPVAPCFNSGAVDRFAISVVNKEFGVEKLVCR